MAGPYHAIAGPPRALVLLAWLAWLPAAAAAGGGGGQHRAEPYVSARSDELEFGSVRAKVIGSRARAMAAVSRARFAQARASALEMYSEQLRLQTRTKTSALEDMAGQASSQAEKAAQASERAVGALKEMQATAAAKVQEAGELAVQGVQDMLAGKYQELDAWRKGTLTDLHAQAEEAGARAAAPYKRALKALRERIQAYQVQARTTALQANAAIAQASVVAREAQARMQHADTIGANQDIQMARAIQAKGVQLATHAKALQASAVDMNKMVGLYIAAENAAARRAEYDVDPNGMPPLQIDPNIAFTPPPPL